VGLAVATGRRAADPLTRVPCAACWTRRWWAR